jgi:hypothetical protein
MVLFILGGRLLHIYDPLDDVTRSVGCGRSDINCIEPDFTPYKGDSTACCNFGHKPNNKNGDVVVPVSAVCLSGNSC